LVIDNRSSHSSCVPRHRVHVRAAAAGGGASASRHIRTLQHKALSWRHTQATQLKVHRADVFRHCQLGQYIQALQSNTHSGSEHPNHV
jgi:hypothetical protein